MTDPPRRPRAPGTDNTLPPARPAVVRAEETDPRVLWQQSEREARETVQAAQRERRRASKPDSDPPPPPAPPPSQKGSIRLPHGTPWWGYLLAIALTSSSGAGIWEAVRSAIAPKPATTEQADDIRARMTRLEEKIDERSQRDDQRARRNELRWSIAAGALCRFNGSKPAPYARSVDCDAVSWDPPPLGALGPWTAREEWPNTERIR